MTLKIIDAEREKKMLWCLRWVKEEWRSKGARQSTCAKKSEWWEWKYKAAKSRGGSTVQVDEFEHLASTSQTIQMRRWVSAVIGETEDSTETCYGAMLGLETVALRWGKDENADSFTGVEWPGLELSRGQLRWRQFGDEVARQEGEKKKKIQKKIMDAIKDGMQMVGVKGEMEERRFWGIRWPVW